MKVGLDFLVNKKYTYLMKSILAILISLNLFGCGLTFAESSWYSLRSKYEEECLDHQKRLDNFLNDNKRLDTESATDYINRVCKDNLTCLSPTKPEKLKKFESVGYPLTSEGCFDFR